jgi:hypothetical protein
MCVKTSMGYAGIVERPGGVEPPMGASCPVSSKRTRSSPPCPEFGDPFDVCAYIEGCDSRGHTVAEEAVDDAGLN